MSLFFSAFFCLFVLLSRFSHFCLAFVLTKQFDSVVSSCISVYLFYLGLKFLEVCNFSSNLRSFFFFFLWPHMLHMEVPGLGVRSEHLKPMPQPWQHRIWGTSATYAAACNNARSWIHWMRPGIEPTSSWTLCGFLPPLSHSGDSRFETFLLSISWCIFGWKFS